MTADVAVVGGGAAGMLAALSAASGGASVVLLEPNEKLGRKLYITGKGRCNLTNDCTPDEVLHHVTCNAKFLYSAANRFSPAAVKRFFYDLGVPLKTERGNRVFPVSDRASDVIDALLRALRRHRVAIVQARARHVVTDGVRVTGVETDRGAISCKAIILVTGGMSYPRTGSTGDGYTMAAELGHTIVPLKPSLVPLEVEGTVCADLQGLSLSNVALQVKTARGKAVYRAQGELLFTHFGISGPLVLSASAHTRDFERERYYALIDLKPALDEQTLDARLLRDFSRHTNKAFANALDNLLPRRMIPVVVARSGIPPQTRVHSITKRQRQELLAVFKAFRLEIAGPRPIEEAVVTSGGVKVAEIDPGSMASKRLDGLFFAGEVMDVDAYTGGFNLQIAWCTGKVAGEAAAQYVQGG
ncbi:MAG: NAD(P)/FAD-dependent oxidoreductase [Clostridiales bacterium]|nr:NAD(P)/FAD-dependent oxidoreductase [Clostridiales bacterium]